MSKSERMFVPAQSGQTVWITGNDGKGMRVPVIAWSIELDVQVPTATPVMPDCYYHLTCGERVAIEQDGQFVCAGGLVYASLDDYLANTPKE